MERIEYTTAKVGVASAGTDIQGVCFRVALGLHWIHGFQAERLREFCLASILCGSAWD